MASERRGIILAGGSGTRLRPITTAVNKHLIPIYDKPMIHYPLSVLMLGNVREVLIITNPPDVPAFQRLYGDGSRLGMRIEYAVQDRPGGIPEAYKVGRSFLDGRRSALILGDNLFHSAQFGSMIRKHVQAEHNSVFLFYVKDPSSYGVAVVDERGAIVDVVEKPTDLVSNFAITGLYLFDADAPDIADDLTLSERGELEVTDIIRFYLERDRLAPVHLRRGVTWMDMGTPDRITSATTLVQAIDNSRNLKIAVPEEIAWRNGWIDTEQLFSESRIYKGTSYGDYLTMLPQMRNL
jgi:glucose-1-phosphate thymidylyltransferase